MVVNFSYVTAISPAGALRISVSHYSVRKVRIGSMRIARTAGIYMAIMETAASTTAEIPNTAESNRWSGNGDLASNRLNINMAGSANAIPAIPSHSAENIGDADCKQLFVEKK